MTKIPCICIREALLVTIAEQMSNALRSDRRIYVREADVTIKQEAVDAYLVTYEHKPKKHARFRSLELVSAAVLAEAAAIGTLDR